MSRFVPALVAVGAALLLAACETYPSSSLLRSFDECDRQAEFCLASERNSSPFYDERGRRIRCADIADRCFSDALARAQARSGGLFYLDSGYVFYGRAGYWTPRRGFVPGRHGRPYSYRRDRGYGPGYDDPNDCYGYRRAYWCDDPYYRDRPRRRPGRRRDDDRDRDRDRGDQRKPDADPPSRDRPSTRPVRPPDPTPRPAKPSQPKPPASKPPAKPSEPKPPAREPKPPRPSEPPKPSRPAPEPEPDDLSTGNG